MIDFKKLKETTLFMGIEATEIEALLPCLSASTKTYDKGQFIHRRGDIIHRVGVVLSGCIHIIKEDFWGNRSILSEMKGGQLFGESYAILPSEGLAVSIYVAQDCQILFLDVAKIMTVCGSACEFHTKMARNLLMATAQRNLQLTQKLEYMAYRSTREKLLAYLSAQSQRQQSTTFDIPFNRQQLADYLSVDRSAMSNELSKLRDEGLLNFHKNHFELL